MVADYIYPQKYISMDDGVACLFFIQTPDFLENTHVALTQEAGAGFLTINNIYNIPIDQLPLNMESFSIYLIADNNGANCDYFAKITLHKDQLQKIALYREFLDSHSIAI